MDIPIKGGVITAKYTDLRPLEGPKTHVHGAIDISGGDGMVVSPASGVLVAYVFRRPQGGTWSKSEKKLILSEPPHNYWHDIYGGILTIEEKNGRYHILTHFYEKAINDKYPLVRYIESSAIDRWAPFVRFSLPVIVKENDLLLPIGNAGYSTGNHLHWEIHHSRRLDDYSYRLDPLGYVR